MPTRTVDEGFRVFHTRLTPTSIESEAAQRHRASMEACLKRNFGLYRFFRSGSFGNGTSISGYSDVDYFAWLPYDSVSSSSSKALTQVRDALNIRFPRTGVRVNCPAVKVPFGLLAKENTEVVPAIYHGDTDDGYDIYAIPNCQDGWMQSSPDAHNSYVTSVNKSQSGKVKPLIRFIKAWKYYQNVPISSFYLELRVAKYAAEQPAIIYDLDVQWMLARLHRDGLARMQDPMGVSGYINPCSTLNKLADARSKLSTAVTRANKAAAAKQKGDNLEAFAWWNLLYNGHFPSYYY